MSHIFDTSRFEALHTPVGALYLAAVLGLLGLLLALRRLAPVFFVAIFPATVVHELMHFGAALLLKGKPSGFGLIPRRRKDGYVLGSVCCANVRWYNGLFIGLAPLALLVVAVILSAWRVRGFVAMNGGEVLWIYTIACITYAAIPSWQDIKVALTSVWLLATSGAVVACYYWLR